MRGQSKQSCRNGKHGLYGTEGSCLIVVEILFLGGVLNVIDVGGLL